MALYTKNLKLKLPKFFLVADMTLAFSGHNRSPWREKTQIYWGIHVFVSRPASHHPVHQDVQINIKNRLYDA